MSDPESKNTNKTIYLVVAKGEISTEYYLTSKLNKGALELDFVGYELKQTANAKPDEKSKPKTIDELNELIKKKKLEQISLSFPWDKIFKTINLSYKSK